MATTRDVIERFQMARERGRLWPALSGRIRPYLIGCKYLLQGSSTKVALHCPDYVEPDPADAPLVKRIFQSYLLMKEDQGHASELYQPAPHWQKILRGYQLSSFEKFHHFAANFGTWKNELGVSNGAFMHSLNRSVLTRRYCEQVIFIGQLKLWGSLDSSKPISRLAYPAHGNQAGAFIDQVFVGPGSFDNEMYGSALSSLISNLERPVIAELGAGYGKLAYFIVRGVKEFIYIDYDLPEVLCLAAYYLMKTFPEKKVLLYGENRLGVHDLIFLPSWEIEQLSERSTDLFINKNSLGEMRSDAARNYISHITRATRYFFHLNHERHPQTGNGRGLCGHEYPVPNDFRLLWRHPDLWHMLYRGSIDFNSDIFGYLYERRPGN